MSIICEVYLLLVLFILPFKYVNITTIAFSLITATILGIRALKNRYIKTIDSSGNKTVFLPLVALTLIYLMILVLSPYSCIFTSELYAHLLCGYAYFYYFKYNGVSRFFRLLAFTSVGIQLGICLISDEIFFLWSIGQKSESTAVVFLLMCIEYNYKNRMGFFAYFIALILISLQKFSGHIANRTSLLLLLVFVLTIIVQWWLSKTRKHEIRNVWIVEKSGRYFVFSIIFIFFFSLVWMLITNVIGYTGYHQSIFDNSNNVRFASSLYVFKQFISEPKLLLYGYDQNIFDSMKLGIGRKFLHYLDARVVYAHHSVLAIYQRSGFLFTVLYFTVVSKMFDQSRLKIKNEVLLPIFAISLTMHSYLQTECLLMLLITLNANYDDYAPLFKIRLSKRKMLSNDV